MQFACAQIADLSLKLKNQYRAVLGASLAYGRDERMTREMDSLGLLLQELQDAVVVLQITLDDQLHLAIEESPHWNRRAS